MGHWTDQGFVAQPLSYYKAAIQDVFVEAFGSDFDLNDNLPQGVLIQRLAELFYGMDMDGIEAFARLNLNTMGGVFLDAVGNLRGIDRVLGSPQTGIATITCRAQNFSPFTIAEGTVLTVSQTNETFVVTRNTTIETNVENVSIAFTEDGNSNAIIGNTMTAEGFPQIQNIEIISLFDGTEDESDISYRARIKTEYPAAAGTIESVANLLRALPSVMSVGFLYNDTGSEVSGIPAYCTEWIVAPKPEVTEAAMPTFKQAVAEVIVDNKVAGSPTYGNTTETVTDVFGSQKTVHFTVATEVPVEIQITVGTPESTGVFDLGGVDAIKEVVAKYINALGIGKDVSFSRCIAPFAAETGFDITRFEMSVKPHLVDDENRVYIRNLSGDSDNTMGWSMSGGDDTIYYTSGSTFPQIDDKIYSDAECTTEFATITAAIQENWLQNTNILIGGREYATIQTQDIKLEI